MWDPALAGFRIAQRRGRKGTSFVSSVSFLCVLCVFREAARSLSTSLRHPQYSARPHRVVGILRESPQVHREAEQAASADEGNGLRSEYLVARFADDRGSTPANRLVEDRVSRKTPRAHCTLARTLLPSDAPSTSRYATQRRVEPLAWQLPPPA